jgi:hypothetical protein
MTLRSALFPAAAAALLLLTGSGCESAARRNCEELRTLGRQLGDLRGEVDNDVQILAACAAQNPDREVALAAASGILAIVGPPDADELVLATSLTAEGVQDVIAHGVSLVKKRQQILDRYLTAKSRLIVDYSRISGRASAFSLVKFLALGGGAVLLLLLFRRIF